MYTSRLEHAVVIVNRIVKTVSEDDLYPFQKAGVSIKPGRCLIARAAGVISDANSFHKRQQTLCQVRSRQLISLGTLSQAQGVYLTWLDAFLAPRAHLPISAKTNDTRKLPQQHGSSGSCNNRHCVNSARSMGKLVEESLSVVARVAVLHSAGFSLASGACAEVGPEKICRPFALN